MLALASDTRSKSNYWLLAPSPPLGKPWTSPPIVSNRLEPIGSSIPFYFAKPFGMLATTKLWSMSGTTSIASCKRGEDHRHRVPLVRRLHLPISPTFWNASTTHPCERCTTNRFSRMEETMTGITSEVAVFMP